MVEEKRTALWRRGQIGTRLRQRARGSLPRLEIPSAVQLRLESSSEYQELLVRLLELSEQLQSTLSAEQRATWLALEDAFFDHAQLIAEYHYGAGR